MWGNVSHEVGEARQRQLSTVFFKPAIDKGARLLRHVGDIESAHSIIRAILDNNPLALQIQEELVDKHMEFPLTAAGEEISRGLNEYARRLEDKIKKLRSELQDAEERGRETQRELEEENNRLREKLDAVRSESMRLGPRYKKERVKTQEKTDNMLRDLAYVLGGVFALGFIGGLLLSLYLIGAGFRHRARARV